jgi:hypothetical protein
LHSAREVVQDMTVENPLFCLFAAIIPVDR